MKVCVKGSPADLKGLWGILRPIKFVTRETDWIMTAGSENFDPDPILKQCLIPT